MFSMHSHSGEFCLHATGTLEQIVQQAVSRGFRVYALTEHMPRYSIKHLYPEEVSRMTNILICTVLMHDFRVKWVFLG